MPDAEGMFGPYGGQLVPPHLKKAMDDISEVGNTTHPICFCYHSLTLTPK